MTKLKSFDLKISDSDGIDFNYSIGFYVSDKEKNKINLFSIDKKNNYFIYDAPIICQKLLKNFALAKSIHDIEWTYTAAPISSKLEFKALNGLAVIMRFDNGEVVNHRYGRRPLDYYEKALNDPRGLMVSLQEGIPNHLTSISEPIIKYLVHTPKRSREIHVLDQPNNYPVVLINTEFFIHYWNHQCSLNGVQIIKNLFRGKVIPSNDDEDRELLKSSYETSLKFSIPNEMASGVHLNFKNKISFQNGRHRTVNIANAGALYIPVQTNIEGANTFRELFGWAPAKNFNLIQN